MYAVNGSMAKIVYSFSKYYKILYWVASGHKFNTQMPKGKIKVGRQIHRSVKETLNLVGIFIIT